MKILLSGGGTAGHVTPALAIAEIFKFNHPEAEICFVGTPAGIERRLVTEAGYRYFPIPVMGLSRSLTPKNLRAVYLALLAKKKAKRLLRELCPDLVIGTGGYVCFPVLSAACSLGIPTALHESNAIPGLAVRHLAKKADLLLLNFSEVERLVKARGRVVQVGNPHRTSLGGISKDEARERLQIPKDAHVLLSFGGSLGAEAMNRAILALWKSYVLSNPAIHHFHGTGARYAEDFRQLSAALQPLPDRIRVYEYITEMPTLMAAADLIICRSGAMTISEVARAGKAAILIPSPNVANDHQTKNAEALAEAGAAILLPEAELVGNRMEEAVQAVLEDDGKRKTMERAIKAFAVPDANRKIYRELTLLLKEKKKMPPAQQ
ncbi:MAG: undecaprenyldiphospho-muramoylpentapeptide beta-N-acetylglucosaminyltransferase [Clostridia bacterium]|nr:undecaprenyldiphospho-muramoylpentapeptide beta-N-acetylglucosaminyltransferase [Clostridia bacterium]